MYAFGNEERVWMRFSFKLTTDISTIMKFARFYDPTNNTNLGGFFIESGNSILTWGWDQEDGAIATPINIAAARVLDGQFHSLEVDYWRNGDPSGHPSAAFWLDGKPVSYPDGTDNIKYWGAGNHSYWRHGRLDAGERRSTVNLGLLQGLSTLNKGNTRTGKLWVDRFAFSSRGPIAP